MLCCTFNFTKFNVFFIFFKTSFETCKSYRIMFSFQVFEFFLLCSCYRLFNSIMLIENTLQMITIIMLPNTSLTLHNYHFYFFCVVKPFNIYSIINFQVYSTSINIIAMVYITYPELINQKLSLCPCSVE